MQAKFFYAVAGSLQGDGETENNRVDKEKEAI